MKKVWLWLYLSFSINTLCAQIGEGDVASSLSLYTKFSPELRERVLQRYSQGKDFNGSKFLIACWDAPQFRTAYSSDTLVRILTGYGNCLQLQSTVSHLMYLAAIDSNIIFVQSGDRMAKEEAALSDYDLSLNRISFLQQSNPPLRGQGLVASVKENRPDTADIDLSTRLLMTSNAATSLSTHATVMSTLLAGAGNTYTTGKGVATAAIIAPSSFAVLLPDADNWYSQNKVSVQNHSYGTGIENFYGSDAAAYDASVITNPSLLHVFSAGNMGDQAPSSGAYINITGFANLTGSFKMSKNTLSVGATDAAGNTTTLSSRGPAYDGRIKPELVAYGQDGSSGAAALVSGTAILLQQAYADRNGGRLPDAALLKAVFAASAVGHNANPVDFAQGYGALDAYRAVGVIARQQYLAGSINAGQSKSFPLIVPANAKNLRICIAWSDPANTPNAPSALVNDLDMRLIENNSGQSWEPWILRTNPDKDSLAAPAKRGRDSINNMELVTRGSNAGGNYTITVTGKRVSGSQLFSVAYTWDSIGAFNWTYPTAADRLTAGSLQKLRWYMADSAGASLDYTFIGQNNWKALAADTILQAGTGWLQWQVPDTNAAVLIRANINNRTIYSDTVFISRGTELKTGYACGDSVLLYWNKQKAASAYRLSQLSQGYMQQAALTTDSFATVATGGSKWWTVTPVFNRSSGLPAHSIDYSQQGVGCYISTFTADISNATGLIAGQLGTLYNVRSVFLEKADGNGHFQLLKDFSQPLLQQINYSDASLRQGLNYYRVRLELKDGRTIYSDIESIAWLGSHEYLVFPNPILRGQTLNVLSASLSNQYIQFYNVIGQPMYVSAMSNLANAVPTNVFTAGVYYFTIIAGGTIVHRGKLVVQ